MRIQQLKTPGLNIALHFQYKEQHRRVLSF